MNLIRYFDEKIQEDIYFWARESDNIILSPIWKSKEDAETWMDAIYKELNIPVGDPEKDKQVIFVKPGEDNNESSDKDSSE